MCSSIILNEELKDWVLENKWLLWVSFIILLIVAISMLCFIEASQRYPINYIILLIFTICFGYIVSVACAKYEPNTVLATALMTMGITIALSLYAVFSRVEWEYIIPIFIVVSITSFFLFIFMIIDGFDGWTYKVFCGCGVIIYGIYIIIHTSMIVQGSKH